MGHSRIPIQKWFRDHATESIQQAILVGEKITSLGGDPPAVTAAVKGVPIGGRDLLQPASNAAAAPTRA